MAGCAQDRHSPLVLMLKAGCYDGVRLLVSARADVDAPSKVPRRTESAAPHGGRPALLRQLLPGGSHAVTWLARVAWPA
jgi:hypothetical protein